MLAVVLEKPIHLFDPFTVLLPTDHIQIRELTIPIRSPATDNSEKCKEAQTEKSAKHQSTTGLRDALQSKQSVDNRRIYEFAECGRNDRSAGRWPTRDD